VTDATAWPRRYYGVMVMVVMVAYCCSVQRCHLLQYILTRLLFYYRCDLIYVLRLMMPTASFVAMAVVCCHGRHAHHLRNDIYLGHGIFFATAVIVNVADVSRFMAQMTADGRDSAVDCRFLLAFSVTFRSHLVAFGRIWSQMTRRNRI
jgi:hypothetical protein